MITFLASKIKEYGSNFKLKTLHQDAKTAGIRLRGLKTISKSLKKEFMLRYRTKSVGSPACNSSKNLVLRQFFGLSFLNLLETGMTVLNVDESTIERLDYQRRCW